MLNSFKKSTMPAEVRMALDSYTTSEWQQKIGSQVRSIRLLRNIEQTVVAAQAGISVTAIKNLESGKGATIKTLIKVLRVYGREDWFNTLAPSITISPLQMLTLKSKRQRARGKKSEDAGISVFERNQPEPEEE